MLAQARLRVKLGGIIQKFFSRNDDSDDLSQEFEKILREASTFTTPHFFKSVEPLLV